MSTPGVVVFGATGEIGRWLVAELTGAGEHVAVVMRKAVARRAAFADWVAAHGGDAGKLAIIEGDLTHEGFGIDATAHASLAHVRLIYNVSGRYSWGLTPQDAAAVNVEGAARIVDLAAELATSPRVVHVSGYLVASEKRLAQLGLRRDVTPGRKQWARLNRELGAYEASKMEGDFAVRAAAARRDVALTIVNPAAVIGHSKTGEIAQTTGFGELVDQLWRGVMTAIPGTPDDRVPQVPVDYLAAFMARVPMQDTAPLAEYTVLCPDTPRFPDMIRLIAAHLGVSAPKSFIPVGLAKALLRAGLGKLTGTSAEPLSFLVPFDFDTSSADAAAKRAGLVRPDVTHAIEKTLDHLVATRFGAAPEGRGGFHSVAGVRTFADGDPAKAQAVLLHGLPLTAASWNRFSTGSGLSTLAADLPGQGRSELTGLADEERWLNELMQTAGRPVLLIAHSYACRVALRFASSHPQAVAGLVLVAPYFQLPRLPLALRWPLAASTLLRLGGAQQLTALGQDANHLRRPGARKRIAERLRLVGSERDQALLRRTLIDVAETGKVPVLVIEGSDDRLIHPIPAGVGHVSIAGAAHNPQITHASEVAAAIARFHAGEQTLARVRMSRA